MLSRDKDLRNLPALLPAPRRKDPAQGTPGVSAPEPKGEETLFCCPYFCCSSKSILIPDTRVRRSRPRPCLCWGRRRLTNPGSYRSERNHVHKHARRWSGSPMPGGCLCFRGPLGRTHTHTRGVLKGLFLLSVPDVCRADVSTSGCCKIQPSNTFKNISLWPIVAVILVFHCFLLRRQVYCGGLWRRDR